MSSSAHYPAGGQYPADDSYQDDDSSANPGEDYLERPLLPQHDDENPVPSYYPNPRRPSSAASNTSIFDLPVTSDNVPWPERLRTQYAEYVQKARDTWDSMATWQRVVAIIGLLVLSACGIAVLVLSRQLMHWIVPKAEQWEKSGTAYAVIGLLTFTVSFPPLIGWALIGTCSGFIFGVWKGWFIYAIMTVIGSVASVYASRTILQRLVRRLVEHDHRFAALSLTLKYDGLKLLCMIRLCPLPYSVCNGAMATFDTVQPLMYGLATLIVTPKLLITVFIGSRLRILLEKGEKMSIWAKMLNVLSILITVSVGVGTAMYIYKSTLARAKELEDAEREAARHLRQSAAAGANGAAAAAAAAAAAGLPSPRAFADSPLTPSFGRNDDEERMIGFHDDLDDDNDAVAIPNVDAHSTFTDHEDDVFDLGDGDGDIGGAGGAATRRESFRLHSKVKPGQAQAQGQSQSQSQSQSQGREW